MMVTAQDILESPVFLESWAELHQELHDLFAAAPPSDSEELQHVAYRLEALGDIRAKLEQKLKLKSINLKGK